MWSFFRSLVVLLIRMILVIWMAFARGLAMMLRIVVPLRFGVLCVPMILFAAAFRSAS
ncbi:hypothetical protein D3C87_1750970 [compost metagenome]